MGDRWLFARTRVIVLPALTVLLVVLAGCGGGDSSSSSDKWSGPKVLRYGVTSKLDTYNPAKDSVNSGTHTRYLTTETLIAKDPKTGDYGPGLATEFGFVGKDNLAYEFTLREDAKFSDGTPLDAAAVKKWLEYFAKAGGPWSTYVALESIDTPDAYTVRLNFKAPSPNIEYFLAGGNNWGFVSSPKGVDNPKLLAENMMGAGPYVMDRSETVAGNRYTFKPNPNYYDKAKIKWDKIVVRVISDAATMMKALQSGELDAAQGDYSTIKAAESADGLTIHWGQGGWDPILLLTKHSEPLRDVRVRQALNYAIDREAITKAMLGKYGEPTSEWVTSDGFDPEYQDYYEYDPAKAKQLLAEAGYGNGLTLKVVDQGYYFNVGDRMVQIVADYMSKVGVTFEITKTATASEHLEKGLSGEYDAMQFMVGSVPTATFLGFFTEGFGVLPDPELDAIAKRASVASKEEQPEIWKEFSRRTVEQASMLNVFTVPTLIYARDAIAGITATRAYGVSPALLQWAPKT
jgi:peptide/nickel transport system substrate-binding protein